MWIPNKLSTSNHLAFFLSQTAPKQLTNVLFLLPHHREKPTKHNGDSADIVKPPCPFVRSRSLTGPGPRPRLRAVSPPPPAVHISKSRRDGAGMRPMSPPPTDPRRKEPMPKVHRVHEVTCFVSPQWDRECDLTVQFYPTRIHVTVHRVPFRHQYR